MSETRQDVSVHHAKKVVERYALRCFENSFSILAIATHGERGTRLTMRVKLALFPCSDNGMFLWLRGKRGFLMRGALSISFSSIRVYRN